MKVGIFGGKFLPLHTGHVYAITKAACEVDELYVVLSWSQKRDKKLANKGIIQEMPSSIRLRWLSQLTKDMENVKVIGVEDTAETDDEYDWEKGAEDIKGEIGKQIDVVFGSEVSYKKIFNQLYPDAEYKIIDADRNMHPISATKIREEGPFKHWNYIPDVVKPYFVKTVVIVGTESCGKSTLSRYLSKIYNTNYVEEYGRIVCEELGGCDGILTKEDFYHIAYGHKMKEEEAKKHANKITFIDSEAIVTQYYADLYLEEQYDVIDEIIKTQKYDLWLFMEPDVKWVNDGLRVHGDQMIRERNNLDLKNRLQKNGVTYKEINGSYTERLEKAMKEVNKLFDEHEMINHRNVG